jgi:hypothetical protein
MCRGDESLVRRAKYFRPCTCKSARTKPTSSACGLGFNRACQCDSSSDGGLVTLVDPLDHRGRRAYRFEIDNELPPDGPYFLRTEGDTGTERVIRRRLRNIKALDIRFTGQTGRPFFEKVPSSYAGRRRSMIVCLIHWKIRKRQIAPSASRRPPVQCKAFQCISDNQSICGVTT